MEDLLSKVETLRETDEDVRSNMLDISDLNDEIVTLSPALYAAVDNYIHSVSVLAETNRQIKALKEQKDKVVSGDDYTIPELRDIGF